MKLITLIATLQLTKQFVEQAELEISHSSSPSELAPSQRLTNIRRDLEASLKLLRSQ